MSCLLNLVGHKYGRLTVISRASNEGRFVRWNCRCECGGKVVVRSNSLRTGHTKSCGCLDAEKRMSRITKHGGRYTRLYRVWRDMKHRCTNKKFVYFAYYGGRGITVCDEWANSFEAFRDWALSHGYTDELTIDRIDYDGHYCPDNCRFITMKEQQRNKRNNHVINGKCLAQWAEESGINQRVLSKRIARGWGIEQATSMHRTN